MEEEEDSVQRRKHGSSSKGTLRDGLRGKKIFPILECFCRTLKVFLNPGLVVIFPTLQGIPDIPENITFCNL